ncbi:MAG TPA: hypothetical protein VFH67_04855, partial [bacterium]|nr:hypothetical protein [bacterium]
REGWVVSVRLVLLGITLVSLLAAGHVRAAASIEAQVLVPEGGRVAWSHARNLIAFDRRSQAGTFEIYTIHPDGSDEQCLTCERPVLPRSHRGNPAWHPSGEYVAFQAHDPALSGGRGPKESYTGTPGLGINNDIWLMKADGTHFWRITRVKAGGGVLHPHFSHDGRLLLWSEIVDPSVRGLGGQWAIKIAEIVLSEAGPYPARVRTLRPGDLQLYETHAFSPDDRRILFSGAPRRGDYFDLEIYAFDLTTSRLTQLTRNNEWDEHAQFTADGKRIVWASSEGVEQRKDPRDLKLEYWIMNDDGSSKQRLTRFNDPSAPEFRPGALAADFEFGPDGKTIVAKLGAAARGETVVLIRLLD